MTPEPRPRRVDIERIGADVFLLRVGDTTTVALSHVELAALRYEANRVDD